jgi:hypothetical protein
MSNPERMSAIAAKKAKTAMAPQSPELISQTLRNTVQRAKGINQRLGERGSIPTGKGKVETSIQKALKIRQNKVISESGIDNKLAQGYTVETTSGIDSSKLKNLQQEYDVLKKTAPIGNSGHPDTIRYKELKEIFADKTKQPTKMSYWLKAPDGTFIDTNKTIYDYANSKLSTSTGAK